MSEPVILTEEQLAEKVNHWRKILRLEDWDFWVRIARRTELHSQEDGAEVEIRRSTRSVTIAIMDSVDYPDCVIPQDMEVALVHEMLHVLFEPVSQAVQDDTFAELEFEAAIERTALALVAMDRSRSGGAKM